MKHRLFLSAVLVMALAVPQSVKAYSFSAVAPSGQTLFYNITQYPYNGNASVEVTYYNTTSNPWPSGSPSPAGVLTIPDSVIYNDDTYVVTAIGNYAFKGCTELSSVSIPNSITSIGIQSFYGCCGLEGTLIIRNTVSSIGNFAFADCSRLSSITVGNNVVSIGNMAFYNVRHVEYHGSATGAPWSANSINGVTEGDFVYANTSHDTLIAYIGNGGEIIIPSTVTAIGNNAFRAYPDSMSITFPSTLISIGWDAFYGCTGLTGLLLIPNSVTSIQGYAFAGCSGLYGPLHIPDSLTLLGNNAFNGCSGFTGDLIIGNLISLIDDKAFYGCSGLSSLTIGNSVTSIGYESFCGCAGLSIINSIPDEAPSLGYGTFTGVSDTIKVNIPCGSSASYIYSWTTSALFSNSNFFEDRLDFQVRSQNNQKGSVSVQIMPTCQNSNATFNAVANIGYKFVSWSDGITDNPRNIILTQDTVIEAIFDLCDTIFIHDTTYVDVFVHDTTYIDVHDTTFVDVHDTTYVTDTITFIQLDTVTEYVYDTTYIDVHDTTFVDVHDTTYITDTMTLVQTDTVTLIQTDTVTFVQVDTVTVTHVDTVTLVQTDTVTLIQTDTVTVTQTDTITNTVYDTTVVDNFIYDTTLVTDTLWLTDTLYLTEYIHDTVYIHDTIYVGVDEVQAIDVKLYQRDGNIIVAGAEGMEVAVYDVMGHQYAPVPCTSSNLEGELRIAVPASGVYLVKVGNHPARKVVVVR